MQRLLRIAGSFAIVLVAYWVYAHTAVPLIEPPIAKTGDGTDGKRPDDDTPPSDEVRYKEIEGLSWSPGYHWELDKDKKPMILDINNRAKLLLQKYDTQPDGSIKLYPCTVIFLHDGPAESEAERKRQTIVLEAPEGAIVKFDAPIDLKGLKIGRPVGGHLLGEITIRSEGKSPGPEDDLLIHARDVVWNDRDATSENPVEFQWGKNYGRGRGMHIKLAGGPNPTAEGNGPNISGIEVFEMQKIDRLHLEGKPKPTNSTAADAAAPASDLSMMTSDAGDQPVDITCRGAFRFNLVERVASFEDHVEVMRPDPKGGPADQLLCDKLSMFFIPRDKDQTTSGTSVDNLEPERLEAQGKPVTLTSPQKNVYAQGERMAFNLKTSRIALDGGPEVYLKQGGNEIRGRSLQYEQENLLKAPGTLGKAWVKGPGRLHAAMEDKPDQRLDASWNGELRLSPQDGYQVISITGGGALEFAGFGKMAADNIYFWLLETAPAGPAGKPQIKPIKMSAKTNVALEMTSKAKESGDTTQITGNVDELNVWFEEKNVTGGMRWETQGGSVRGQGRPAQNENAPPSANIPVQYLDRQPQTHTAYRQPVPLPPQTQTYPRTQAAPAPAIVRPMNMAAADGTPMYPSTPSRAENSSLPPGQGVVPVPAGGRRQCFTVSGRLLDAKVVVQEPEYKLTDLTLTDNVSFKETQTLDPAEKPLLITGDKVVAENMQSLNAAPSGMNAPPSAAKVTVLGRPAHVEGHRLSLNGSNINLDLAANNLSIEGPGSMELPMPDNINGQPLAAPGSLLVKWKEGMNFDGLTATFRKEIDASSPMRHLQTETLSVRLRQPMRFADPDLQNRKQPDAAYLSCLGGVFMESVELDEQQQRSGYIRMQVADLNFDMQSGELVAGPGWLNSVNLIAEDSAQMGFGSPVRNTSLPVGNSNTMNPIKKLVGLHVRFEQSITGNITSERQRINFRDRVRVLYAPVADWSAMLNPDKTEPLAAEEIRLKCDSLGVRNRSQFPGKGNAMELDALGNAYVEGKMTDNRDPGAMFYASAMRIGYDAAKDQLIMEGDGRTFVHFYRQLQVGTQPDDTAMKTVIYHPRKNTFSMSGIQSGQINQFTPGNK